MSKSCGCSIPINFHHTGVVLLGFISSMLVWFDVTQLQTLGLLFSGADTMNPEWDAAAGEAMGTVLPLPFTHCWDSSLRSTTFPPHEVAISHF